jgi:NH3-dependent NAD+ synthetase
MNAAGLFIGCRVTTPTGRRGVVVGLSDGWAVVSWRSAWITVRADGLTRHETGPR